MREGRGTQERLKRDAADEEERGRNKLIRSRRERTLVEQERKDH